MKLISLKCPSCGAKLEVNGDLDEYTCNYCGVTTLLDDEIITVKHVESKFNTEFENVNDYYKNGNYLKAYNLAIDLLEEYPKNKKLRDIFYKCKVELSESLAKEIITKDYDTVPGNYVNKKHEVLNDLEELNNISDGLSNNYVDEALKRLVELEKKYDNEAKDDYEFTSKMGCLIGIIVLSLPVLFIILSTLIAAIEDFSNNMVYTSPKADKELVCKGTIQDANDGRVTFTYDNNGNDIKKVQIYLSEKKASADEAYKEYSSNVDAVKKLNDTLKGVKVNYSFSGTYVISTITFDVHNLNEDSRKFYVEMIESSHEKNINDNKSMLEAEGLQCSIS